MAPREVRRPRSALPAVWRELPGLRPMVIAPHMDDEVIGCGGVLARYADTGRAPSVSYCAFGAPATAVRRGEARAAAHVLGISRSFELPACDGHGASGDLEPVVDALRRIHADTRFDVLFVPHVAEWHPEHRAAARIAAAFLQRDPGIEVKLFGYEVWSCPFPQVLCDVSSVFSRKEQALACYRSELEKLRYAMLVDGLGRMRAALLRRGGTHAEAFQAYPSTAAFLAAVASARLLDP